MTTRREQAGAVFFSVLMVVSMVASSVAFGGLAAADRPHVAPGDDGDTGQPLETGTASGGNATVQPGASFEVSNAGDLSIDNGTAIDLSADVKNIGNESGTQTMRLSINGSETHQTSLTLSAGGNDTVTFSGVDTGALGSGDHTYTISSANDSAAGGLTVQSTESGDGGDGGDGSDSGGDDSATTADVNQSASSVTPTAGETNESRTYTVTVRIDDTSLANDTGEVDVRFENFALDTAGNGTDLTIEYTADDVTDGTLTVSESVDATAPATKGTRDVDVTDLRRDTGGGTEFLIEDANATIGTIAVSENETSDDTVSETTTFSSDAVGTQQVDVDPSDLEGNGEDVPYEISNASELQAMEDDLDANYELVADIDASGTAQWNNSKGFDPVGGDPDTSDPFIGSLDGNDHTITNLTINRPNESAVGLFGGFGKAGNSARITNVSLTNHSVSGNNVVGGVVGQSRGSGDLQDPTEIRNVTVSGNVTAQGGRVGLIAGQSSGKVTDVIVLGEVKGNFDVGGLVGFNIDDITDVTTTATVTTVAGEEQNGGDMGGVVGLNKGSVTDATASGDVTSDSNDAGGIVGDNDRTYRNEPAVVRNATASGEVEGLNLVGGLTGVNSGTVANSTASGNVTSETLPSEKTNDNFGGLVGSNGGSITNSTASGDVDTTSSGEDNTDEDAGGLVGGNSGLIANTKASGSVNGERNVGGLVGRNTGDVQDSFAVGLVAGDKNKGGLVGNDGGAVEDAYWDREATNQSGSDGNATGLTTAEMQGQAAATNMSGFDFENNWTTTSDYPALRALSETGHVDPSDLSGDGTESNPYEISNAFELQAMEDDLDANYELVADIDASNTSSWYGGKGFDPIGGVDDVDNAPGSSFSGTFDGNGHTITGLTIARPNEEFTGLFGNTSSESVIREVTVTSLSVTGDGYVGGVIGRHNGGTVRNVSTAGAVTGTGSTGGIIGRSGGDATISDVSASVTVTGTAFVGGVVGTTGNPITDVDPDEVEGSVITNASATGDVRGIKQSSSESLTHAKYVGGLVGFNNANGTIRTASASGDINGTETGELIGGLVGGNYGTIRNVSATGSAEGFLQIGGLVGLNDGPATIEKASASGGVTGATDIGGLAGSNRATLGNASASGAVTIANLGTPSSRIAGGLVGVNSGTVRDTFAVGSVSSEVSGVTMGGLVGQNYEGTTDNNGTVRDSYWDQQTTSQSVSAGSATSLNTSQMAGEAPRSNMSGLTYGEVWTTQPNDYPVLIDDPKGPTAVDDAYTTDEDTPLNVLAPGVLGNDTDPDNDTLTATVVNRPTNGSLTLDADGSFEYTPDADFAGTDSFTYNVSDGTLSDTGTVTITVSPVNDAPSAVDDSYTTTENESVSVSAPGVLENDSDVDGDELSATRVIGPTNGTLSLDANGSFEYTPNPGFFGTDLFTYNATDGELNDTATVTITVTEANDPPVAVDDGYTTPEDSKLDVDAPGVLDNDSDPNDDALNAMVVSGPSNGTLSLDTDGSFSYDPESDFTGTDSFTYNATDGELNSTATVTINVTAVDDTPPVLSDADAKALDGRYSVRDDDVVEVSVNVTDPGGSAITSVTVDASGFGAGTVSLSETNVEGVYGGTFTVNASKTRDRSAPLQITATDGAGNSDSTETFPLTLDTQPPVARATANRTTIEPGETVRFNASGSTDNTGLNEHRWDIIDSDDDFERESFFSISENVTYTFASAGTYTVDLNVSDAAGNTNTTSITVEVGEANQAPTAADDTYTTPENTTLDPASDVLENDDDPEGDTLNATLVSGPANGTLSFDANGNFSYDPDPDFTGTDSFTYNATDGALNSTATVTITVTPVNNAPVARNDSYTVTESTDREISTLGVPASGVLDNDSDPNGDELNATLVTGPTNGTLSLDANGSFEYTPNQSFVGTDSFTYNATDGELNDTATVTITVTEASEPSADVNESTSSVKPPTAETNGSQAYTVTVRIDNTSLAGDDTGEVDVRFEDFDLSAAGDGNDLTIGYTGSNVTDGTLTVSENVSATAPATAGTRDVNVTDFRRDTGEDGTEFLIDDANVTIDTIEVNDATEDEGPSVISAPIENNETSFTGTNFIEQISFDTDTGVEGEVNVTERDTPNQSVSDTIQTEFVDANDDVTGFTSAASIEIRSGPSLDEGETATLAGSVNASDVEDPSSLTVVRVPDDQSSAEGLPTDVTGTAPDGEEINFEATTTNFSTFVVGETQTTTGGFVVDINGTQTDDSVEPGTTATVVASVTNTRDGQATQTVALDFGENTSTDSAALTLNGSESATVTLTHDVAVDAPLGPTNVTVRTANDSDSTRVEVAEPGDDGPAPTVNVTASSVSPTSVPSGISETFEVAVRIDNTSLGDTAAGDVTVAFDGFNLSVDDDELAGPEEELRIDYTDANVSDGTISVTETVSATAPPTAGAYPITVTDITVATGSDTDEFLIEDANVTIDTIEVIDAPDAPPEADGISFVPAGGSSSFGRNGSRVYAEKIVVATPASGGVTTGDANSRAFRVVQTDTGTNESVLVEPEPGAGTYNVTGASFEIYRPNGTIGYSDPLADRGPTLRVRLANGTRTEIPVTVSGNRDLFDPSRADSSVFDPYAVQLIAENATDPSDSSVLAETEPRVRGIGYDGGPGTERGLRQNSTEGTIEVSVNREPDVNASWDVEYVVASSPESLIEYVVTPSSNSAILNRSVDNADTADNFTATFDGSGLQNGSYRHAFVIRPTEGSDEVYLTLVNENLQIGDVDDGPDGGEDDSQQVDVDPSDLAGNGTEADPYRIANASELQAMADDLDANYTLVTDVNASGTVQWNDGRGFDPVRGNASNESSPPAFTGTFDGDGHTITGLAIDRPNETYTGLFGSLESAAIEDVALADHAVTGESQVGSLVGVSRNSTITNVTTAGLVRGTGRLVGGTVGISRTSALANVSASGDVVGANRLVGGLTGSVVQNSTIRDVTVTSDVSGPDDVGGLTGFNSDGSEIRRATVSADVQGAVRVGGLVGQNQGTIRAATVSGTVNGSNQLGGLVGGAFTDQTVRNTTASSTVTGSDFIGGAVGYTFGDVVLRNATASGDVTGAEDVGGLIGLSGDDTTVRASTASGTVRGSTLVGGLIGFAADRTLVRDSATSSAVDGVEVVGGLVGRIKSNSTIRYSRATGPVNASTFVGGFAGAVGGNSTVRASTAAGAVTGSGQQVGGFVGDADGTSTIRNVTASGNVAAADPFVGGLVGFASDNSTIRGSQASGDVTGADAVGGAVGILTDSATVRRTTASGRVDGSFEVGGLVGDMDFSSAIRSSTASGDVNGSTRVGGLVGGVDGDGNRLRNVAASGAVNGSEDVGGLVGYNGQDNTIRDAFAVGPVNGSVDSGGVTGRSFGTVADAYWDEQATGQNTTGGSAVGLTTAQMQGQAARTNMSGLAFNTTWQATDGYPVLRVSPERADGGDTGGLAPFPETAQPGQATPPSLAGQFRVERAVAGATTIALLQDSATEYSINITAPDGSENVTFYLQEQAVSASQDIDDVRMLLDGQPREFTIVADAGPGNSSWIAFTVPEFSTRTVTFTSESDGEDAALSITAPSNGTYDPNSELTIGTRHNATGAIDDSDVAIRIVNATAGNDSQVALNDSVPVAGSANTTVPASSLSGNVTVEAQLYNRSSETVVAADAVSLVADTGSDGGGGGGGGGDDGGSDGGDDGSGGGNETDGDTGTPSFAVSELEPRNLTITAGDTLTVTATIENVGNASGTQPVEYRIGGATMANATVTLSPGENTTVEFTDIGTTNLVTDDYEHGVFTENASQTGTLTVEAETGGGTDDSTPGFGSVVSLLALLAFALAAKRRGA